MFKAAAREIDEPKRVGMYHRISAQIAGDVPHWWLWDRYYPIGFNAKAVGITDDVTGYGSLIDVKLTP